jgi:hypothetical protein
LQQARPVVITPACCATTLKPIRADTGNDCLDLNVRSCCKGDSRGGADVSKRRAGSATASSHTRTREAPDQKPAA